jgi:hypothetical protein
VEILIGYEVDRSTTPLGGITAVRAISDAVQEFYENNFGYPIVSVEDEKELPTEFSLHQNYPNPFNPSTKIKYTIPTPPVSSPLVKGWTEEGFVTLKVFNVLGKEVATLVDEEKPAGNYEVEFSSHSDEGQNLPSGVYFYQLKTGNYLETRKMILLK